MKKQQKKEITAKSKINTNKSLDKRCICPFYNPKGHWEDRDCDGYDDTWIDAEVMV